MISESTNPFTGRDRFKTRSFRNKVVIGVLFISAVVTMSLFLSIFPGAFLFMLLGDAIALGGAYYLSIVWDKRPIRISCGKCEKIILSNTPWVCGVCKQPNTNGNESSFLDRCSHCGNEPKAYKCHHKIGEEFCGQVIFLTEDHDETDYAYRLNSPAELSKETKRAEKLSSNREEIEDLEHEINKNRRVIIKTQLDERLNAIKKETVEDKRPVGEAKKEGLKNFFDAKSTVKQAAREQKAANAEKHKGDRRARMEDDAIVDMWAQNEMSKGADEK